MGNASEKQVKQSKEIDQMLHSEKQIRRKADALSYVVLGTPDSGKTTFFNCLRTGVNPTEDELQALRKHIQEAVIEQIKYLLQNAKFLKNEIAAGNRELAKAFETSPTSDLIDGWYKTSDASYIKTLWLDPAIQATFTELKEKKKLGFDDYLLSSVDQILLRVWTPTVEQVLHASKGFNIIEEVAWKTADGVNSQLTSSPQSTSREWLKRFHPVSGLIFFVSINDCLEELDEDESFLASPTPTNSLTGISNLGVSPSPVQKTTSREIDTSAEEPQTSTGESGSPAKLYKIHRALQRFQALANSNYLPEKQYKEEPLHLFLIINKADLLQERKDEADKIVQSCFPELAGKEGETNLSELIRLKLSPSNPTTTLNVYVTSSLDPHGPVSVMESIIKQSQPKVVAETTKTEAAQ